jgi:hypothetical protein
MPEVPKPEMTVAAKIRSALASLGRVLKSRDGVVALVLWFLFFGAGVVIGSESFRSKLDGTVPGVGYPEFAKCFLLAILIYSPLNAAIVACLAGYLGGHMSRAQFKHVAAPKREENSARTYGRKVREYRYLTEPPHLSAMRGLVGYIVMLSGVLVFSATPFSSAGFPEETRKNAGDSGTGDPTEEKSPAANAGTPVGQATEVAETRPTETAVPRATSAQDIKAAQVAKDKLKKDKKTAKKAKNPTQLKARSIADSSQYARFGCLVTLLAFGLGYNPMIFERVIAQATSRGIGGDLKTGDGEDDDDDSDASGKEKRRQRRREDSPPPPPPLKTGVSPGAQPSPPAAAGAAEATPPPPAPG